MRRETAKAIITMGPLLLVTGSWREQFYCLPGGGIEAGETAYRALTRELEEELGAQLVQAMPLGTLETSYWLPDGTPIDEHMHLYAAAVTGVPIVDIPPSPEMETAVRWVSIDDIAMTRVVVAPQSVLPWVYAVMKGTRYG